MQKQIGTFILIVELIICTIPYCRAQIDPVHLNKQLLEHEIKTLIDSTRSAHLLPSLFNDSILYIASDHHANYLFAKGILSHEEKENKACLSPQDRARFYGAPKSYSVGENIAFTVYNSAVRVKSKTFQTINYIEIARSLVYGWINSKGHFKNIVHPNYQVTGLAISIDPKTQRIYACQKFAQVLYTYSFPENLAMFPYSQLGEAIIPAMAHNKLNEQMYPFALRSDKTELCESCKETWENYPSMSVRIDNNYFILRIENSDFVKRLIQNKHDGFAVEIVPFDAFACGNPAYQNEASRRNDQKRTSGMVLEPLYRNDLMNGFKKRKKVKNISFVKYIFTADSVSFFKRFGRYSLINFDAKYFEIKLGKVPKDLNTWWHHNLMYIHNKQICHFVYFTNYPGELSPELIDVDYRPPLPVNQYNFKLEYFSDTLDLFYTAGQTISTEKGLEQLIDRFNKENLTIQSVQIQGFCSVEGNAESNDYLHRKRAENILAQLKPLTDSATNYKTQSQVAWEHFYAAIHLDPKWRFLETFSKEELLSYLADPKNEKPLEIFHQERRAKVIIIAVKEFTPKTALYYIRRDLKALFIKDDKGEIYCKNEEELRCLYEKAYYLSTVDTLAVNEFLKIEVPKCKIPPSHALQQDIAFYRYNYLHESATPTVLTQLEANVETIFKLCGAADHLSPEFHYLSACLLVRKLKQKSSISPESPDIQKALDRLNLLLNSYSLDSSFYLNVANANLNIINIICSNIDPEQIYTYTDIVNSSLIQITEYYRQTQQLDAVKAAQLAKMFCYFHNVPLAITLCREFLDDNEILKLYLPLAYFHASYLTSSYEKTYESDFHNLLIEAKGRLSSDDWCKLFYGNHGIPFQVMDNLQLHSDFCITCPNRVNEVLEEE